MSLHFSTGYRRPAIDEPLDNARILHNRNTISGTISATAEAGFAASAADDWTTYEKWQPFASGSGNASWFLTGADATEIDCVCIGAHNLTGGNVTVGYYSGGSWVGLASASPADNSPLMFIFEPVTTTGVFVTIEGVDTPAVGVIKAGKAMQMGEPITGSPQPLKYNRSTTYQANTSTKGEWLGRTIQRSSLAADFSWDYLDEDWVSANWPDAQAAFEEAPFFVAWFPSAVDEVGLVYTTGPASCSYMGSGSSMQASISVVGHAHD